YESKRAHHGKRSANGPELMEYMRQQAVNFGTRIITDDIVRVDLQRYPFAVTSLEGQTVETMTVILAMGARASYLGLASEGCVKEQWRAGMRGLRRCLATVPRQTRRCRWRGRLGRRGRDVHDQIRQRRLPRPPPRSAAGQPDHAAAGAVQPQDHDEMEPPAGR